jgi:hypothetical protein
MQWGSTDTNRIPEFYIHNEHMRVLAEYDLEFEPRREVFEALTYLENKAIRKLGFVLYRQGLKGDPEKLREGIRLIGRAF